MSLSLSGKRLLGRLKGAASAQQPARRIILLYHSVGDTRFAVSASAFAEQMTFLKEHARVLPLEDLQSAASDDRLLCSITFDDGYASIYAAAWPVLKACGFPTTVFLTTSAIAPDTNAVSATHAGLYPDETMLNWRQVRELSAAGVRFGSHLMHHLDLTKMNSKEAEQELRGSREAIEQELGQRCSSIAYPWGKATDETVSLACAAGYSLGVTGRHGAVGAAIDAMRLPRMDVRREYTSQDFGAMLRGDWDYLSSWQAAKARLS